MLSNAQCVFMWQLHPSLKFKLQMGNGVSCILLLVCEATHAVALSRYFPTRGDSMRKVKIKQEAQSSERGPWLLLLDLPDAALQLIFIKYTSRQDKKAVRLTCKKSRRFVDDAMVSATLWYPYKEAQGSKAVCIWANEVWAKSLSQAQHLRTLVLHNCWLWGVRLPRSLTALHIAAAGFVLGHSWDNFTSPYNINSFKNLTALRLDSDVNGRPCVHMLSALTRLETDRDVGTLAALAPTLRHLEVTNYSYVHHVEQLTNLQVLIVQQGLPQDWLQHHGHLPLQHLEWGMPKSLQQPPTMSLTNNKLWKSAPPTLTSIAIHGTGFNSIQFAKTTLSRNVTSLQLLDCMGCTLSQVAAAFPQLVNLDFTPPLDNEEELKPVFAGLHKMKHLQSLRLLMPYFNNGVEWLNQRVLKLSPAQQQRIAIRIVQSKEELLKRRYNWPTKVEWAGA